MVTDGEDFLRGVDKGYVDLPGPAFTIEMNLNKDLLIGPEKEGHNQMIMTSSALFHLLST